jgi:ribosomal peptide maturation radical SAM protein 1
MPCSSIRPPLGVGLLKAHLVRDGHEVTVFNANIEFARSVGVRFYHYLAEVAPVEALLGEYLFSAWVFPDRPLDPYLDFAGSRFEEEFPPPARAQLVQARDQVGPFLADCVEVAERDAYDFVGFSSSFTQNLASLALAKMVKARRPEVLTALGGANCEDEMGLALHRSFDFVDLVFCGEADLSLPRALRSLSVAGRVDRIGGVVWRNPADGSSEYVTLTPPRVRELDDLPFPDYDDFFVQCETLPEGARIAGVPMETSRGCWWGEKHHCTFCGLNGLSMAFRAKSPERALAELDYLRDRHGVNDIQMVDNILDLRYLKSFLPMLAKRVVKPALFYETKANLTREQLVGMRAAGIRAIQAGVESLDTRVLKLMDKGTTGVRSVELLKLCREVGIWPHWNILYGFPEEPTDAYGQMADNADRLHHLDPPNVCTQFRLDRFSPLFARAEEAGLTNVRPARAYDLLYELPPGRVQDLAYYFDFDFRDGRQPHAYTAQLRDAVSRWQRGSGDLTVADRDGVLTILDTRDGEERELLLEGEERDLYRLCASARPLAGLQEELGAEVGSERLRTLLDGWVQGGLMIELDGRYLALAVDAKAARRWRQRRKPSWQEVIEWAVASR